MSNAVWLPGLIVLAAGLAAGLFAAIHLKRGRSGAGKKAEDRDLLLEIKDLERRRDDLYDRLRGYRGEISGQERHTLETAAANTLRKLDELGRNLPEGKLPGEQAKAAGSSPDPAAAAEAADRSDESSKADAGAPSRRPLLAGFFFGVGIAAIVALLVYWAVRDTSQRPQMPSRPMQQPTAEQPHPSPQMPPEVAERVTALEARIAAQPDDVAAAKELAILFLSSGQLFEAHKTAATVLAKNPDDPDANFVHGVVQIAMGRPQEALALLDTVLAQYPEHIQALLYRGLAQQEMGQLDQAIDTWEYALDLSGGSHPDLGELIRRARTARDATPADSASPAPFASAGPSPETPASPTQGPQAQASQALPPAGKAGSYVLVVDLGPGQTAPPGASLFVFLRTGETGPPAAVKRISNPSFPLQIELGAGDTMTGGDLPAEGIIFVRLDADGNASTTAAGDLETSSPATRGESLRLTLGG